jgi:hypothetical protein
MAAVGLGYALFAGHAATSWAVGAMRRAERGTQNPRLPAHHGALGFVERTIYVGAVVAGKPEYAAAWLVIKAATNLGASRAVDRTRVRSTFNRWLAGSGLSLVFGAAGGGLAALAAPWELAASEWPTGRFLVALLAPIALAGLIRFAYNTSPRLRGLRRWARWLRGPEPGALASKLASSPPHSRGRRPAKSNRPDREPERQ